MTEIISAKQAIDPTACSRCGQRPAAVHFTGVVDGAVTTVHLCKKCAPWFRDRQKLLDGEEARIEGAD